MMTVRAVYTGGVLRPVQPLPLAEGETVGVSLRTGSRPPRGNGYGSDIRSA